MLRSVEMFANIGGMGLYQSFETQAYYEENKYCKQILSKRMQQGFLEDAPIYSSLELLPQADILIAAFSTTRQLYEIMKASIITNTTYLFIKTTIHFMKRPKDWRDILQRLASHGFDVTWTVLSSSNIGAPHLRRNWFCVAKKMRPLQDISSNFLAWENKHMFIDGKLINKEYNKIKAPGFVDHKLTAPLELENGKMYWRWITPSSTNMSTDSSYSLQMQVYNEKNTKNKQKYVNVGFIEWLMGFPSGWCDIKRELLTSFISWEKEPNIERMTPILQQIETKLISNATIPQLALFAFNLLFERFQ